MVKLRYMNYTVYDMTIELLGLFPEQSADFSFNYCRQFHAQKELATEFSPYYQLFCELNSFQSFNIKFRKFFGIDYSILLGYFNRAFIEKSEEDIFNHQYERLFSFKVKDTIAKGMTYGITGEYWETGENGYYSFGFDVMYKNQTALQISTGFYYNSISIIF